MYDFPKEHPVLGLLAPPPDAITRALAGRDRTRLQPAGAYAANILGLSEQVPAKAVFLTDGPSRTVKVGPTTIQPSIAPSTASRQKRPKRWSATAPTPVAGRRSGRPMVFGRSFTGKYLAVAFEVVDEEKIPCCFLYAWGYTEER